MTSFIENNLAIIFFTLLGLAVVLITVWVFLYIRLRKLELEAAILSRGMEGKSFAEIVAENINETDRLLEAVKSLSRRYEFVLQRLAGSLQHVGVVRYDAFRELGGRLSFSIALLDDRGNGIAISSIYGRSESRTYAKPVVEGKSSYHLSPEETEAIRRAMQSKELGALPMEAEDKGHEERIATLRLFHERELGEDAASAQGPRRRTTKPRAVPGRREERPTPRTGTGRPVERAAKGDEAPRGVKGGERGPVEGGNADKVSLREYVEGVSQRQPGRDYDRLRRGSGRRGKVIPGEANVGEVTRVGEGGGRSERGKPDVKGRKPERDIGPTPRERETTRPRRRGNKEPGPPPKKSSRGD